MARHPPIAELLGGGSAVVAHLANCPRCRVALRLADRTTVGRPGRRAPAAEQSAIPPVAADRYVPLGPLGVGGMGEVNRVSDQVLGRSVAMKTLLPRRRGDPFASRRFLAEARLTAQLDHPGIVPVYALGVLPDGEVFFTMREISGRTLGQVVVDVHAASSASAWASTPDGWSLRRLVDALRRVCETVGFAHSRGVLHRDLKPANIMLGPWGEVLVLDWGVARQASRGDADDIAGTPGFMAPEQARGDALCPRADVYAVGAMLYVVLAGRLPFLPTSPPAELLKRVGDGVLPDPVQDVAPRSIPDELAELCTRAMAADAADRPPDMSAMGQALADWLDGARKRQQALDLVAEALLEEPRIARLLDDASGLERQAARALESVPAYAEVSEKRGAWAMQDQAAALRRRARLAEVEKLRTLRAALSLAPALPEAHAALAAHHRTQHEAAEARGDLAEAAAAEALLRAHDQGAHGAYLKGDGALSLVTDPPGASVWVARYATVDRRLVAGPPVCVGTTPLAAHPLPAGSYRVELRADGRAPVVYPVQITRLQHWDGVAPGDTVPTPIRLPRLGELGPDDVLVPPGWFRSGGDPASAAALPASRLWCPGFVIHRFPITNRQFIGFLDDLVDRGMAEAALRHAPREHSLGSWADPGPTLYGRDASGHFFLQPDAEGDLWLPEWPVFLVDGWSAWAYADWYAARTGQPWRLPFELEREKAARGVDGRFFPWGDFFDPTFAVGRGSHPGHPTPGEVTAWPLDESPYGVRGLAGNVVDRCADSWIQAGPQLRGDRVVVDKAVRQPPGATQVYQAARGGSWYNWPRYARSAYRIRMGWGDRTIAVGFRLARPWPSG